MIKDKTTGDYFSSVEEFVNYLGILPEIENQCALSLNELPPPNGSGF